MICTNYHRCPSWSWACFCLVILFAALPAVAAESTPEGPPLVCDIDAAIDDTCKVLYDRGRRSLGEGKIAEAISVFRKAYRRSRICWIAIAVATAYVDLQEYDKARQWLGLTQVAVPAHSDLLRRRNLLQENLSARLATASLSISDKLTAVALASASPPLIGPTLPQSSPLLALAITPPRASRALPLYKRWWLWTSVGSLVSVAAAVGVGVQLTRPASGPLNFPANFSGYGNPTP